MVCRQLGFEGPTETVSAAVFGGSSSSILLDDVLCVGTENDIGDCYSNEWGQHDCSHLEVRRVCSMKESCISHHLFHI